MFRENIYYYGDRPLNLIERQLYTLWLEGADSIDIGGAMYFVFKKGPDENTFLPSDFGLKIKKWGKQRKMKFKIMSSPAITSARKFEWFSNGQIFLQMLKLTIFPWRIRSAKSLGFWYQRPQK